MYHGMVGHIVNTQYTYTFPGIALHIEIEISDYACPRSNME